ncbi:MAG: hypothetical protein LUI02_02695, partial [Clostridiales bacterium]|nr:hypothetical protein [Clostridiales bacterium]
LKAADDLAAGKFRAGGATRRNLYLFAMAYGMTYSSDGKADARTDIETNLFRDYYSNNLMRFITEDYKGNLSEFELNPSGQGINYKNFAEMIYLYYISKKCSPQEKIKLSSEMISRVQDSQFKQGHFDMDKAGGTGLYRGIFINAEGKIFSKDVLSFNEKEFEKFICRNYDCDTFAGSYETKGVSIDSKTGVLQLETEQNSALREYKHIIDDLNGLGISPESCDYGLWFTDVAAFKKKGYENICDRNPDIDRDKFGEFMEMLAAIDSFMKFAPDPDLTADAVTRTSMIVAYYYYYNAYYEGKHNDKWKNFREVFNDFKEGIDPKLEAAYYQPLSGKNIFDVLVVFSSYAYMNV